MQSDDKPVNGQHPSTPNQPNFLDLIKQMPPPGAKDAPRTARFARLRTSLQEAWEEAWEGEGSSTSGGRTCTGPRSSAGTPWRTG